MAMPALVLLIFRFVERDVMSLWVAYCRKGFPTHLAVKRFLRYWIRLRPVGYFVCKLAIQHSSVLSLTLFVAGR